MVWPGAGGAGLELEVEVGGAEAGGVADGVVGGVGAVGGAGGGVGELAGPAGLCVAGGSPLLPVTARANCWGRGWWRANIL